MKKLATLLAALALVCACTIPVSAATKQDNEHQIADILEIPETAVEKSVPKPQHLQDKKMMEIVEASEGVIPEDYEIGHLTMIRQRDITNVHSHVRPCLGRAESVPGGVLQSGGRGRMDGAGSRQGRIHRLYHPRRWAVCPGLELVRMSNLHKNVTETVG